MSKYYNEALIPDEIRRKNDVYERIKELGIDLGTFEENVRSLKGSIYSSVIFHESGLVWMSGTPGGKLPMNEDTPELVEHGQKGAQDTADYLIKLLHWALSCGGEGDLNDMLYTVKARGLTVTPGGGASPIGARVANGSSARWHSVFGGGFSQFAVDGVDPIGFSGVHARTAIGGHDGHFSIVTDMIVAIPPALARDIIMNRGWTFPLHPVYYEKVRLSTERAASR